MKVCQQFDLTSVALAMGEAGLSAKIKLDNPLEQRLATFLNEMGNSSDEEVQNLLTVGILEIITNNGVAIMFARKKLKGTALEDLTLIQKYWAD